MYLANGKGGSMTCGLFCGDSPGAPFSGTEIPYISTVINVHVVDLVAEVSLTYKFSNTGDKPINPT